MDMGYSGGNDVPFHNGRSPEDGVNTSVRQIQIRSTISDREYSDRTPWTCTTKLENEEEGLSAEDSTVFK
jgi:hypothetical protein